jgi:hypothetical protein
MYQRIGTATHLTTPQFYTDPISVQMTIDGKTRRTTDFDLCGSSGTTYALTTPEEFWTQDKQRLEFWKWQQFNEQEQVWEDLLVLRLFGTPSNELTVRLDVGGSLRAVYRSSTALQ